MKITVKRLKQIIKEEVEAHNLAEAQNLGPMELRKAVNVIGPRDLGRYGKNRRGTDQISYKTWVKARRALAKGIDHAGLVQIIDAEAPGALDKHLGAQAAGAVERAVSGKPTSLKQLRRSLAKAMEGDASNERVQARIERIKRMILKKDGGRDYLASLQKPAEAAEESDPPVESDQPVALGSGFPTASTVQTAAPSEDEPEQKPEEGG